MGFFCPFVISLCRKKNIDVNPINVIVAVSESLKHGNEESTSEAQSQSYSQSQCQSESQVLHRVVDKAGIEVLEPPCPNFDGCESKSKRSGWACIGHVKPEDRVKMCVEYNRYLNRSTIGAYRVFSGLCGRCLTRFTCGNESFYPDCFQVDRQLVIDQ